MRISSRIAWSMGVESLEGGVGGMVVERDSGSVVGRIVLVIAAWVWE